jgi:hypothetical protein
MGTLIAAPALPKAIATVVVSIVVAGVYSYIGYRLSRRRVSAESRLASVQFSLWWAGLGVSVALTGTEIALAALNFLPFALALTFVLTSILVDVAFLWGLVGFLTYVYTGRYHLLELSVFYAAFYSVAIYWILAQHPYAVATQAGLPVVQYTTAAIPAFTVVIVIGLLAPEIVGAFLYLSLLRRTDDRAQRYRISLVGGSILLFFALDIIIPATSGDWVLLKNLLLVVPGLISLIALSPPEWVRSRLRLPSPEEAEDEGGEARSRS